MSGLWLAVLAGGVGCYLLKLAGLAVPPAVPFSGQQHQGLALASALHVHGLQPIVMH